MRRFPIIASAIAAAVIGVRVPVAHAQAYAPNLVHFGLTAGLTFPELAFNSSGPLGWNLGAIMTVQTRVSPLALRFNAQWLHLTGVFAHTPGGDADNGTRYRILSGTANADYTIATLIRQEKLYVSGGAGAYLGHYQSFSFPASGSALRLGVNGGVGVKIDETGRMAFAELRWHTIVGGWGFLNDASSTGAGPLGLMLLTVGGTF